MLSVIKRFDCRAAHGGGDGGERGARRGSHSDEERKPTPLEDDMCSETSGAGGLGGAGEGGAPRLATEELLAEAAMRSALAAEKQAEAVAQVRMGRERSQAFTAEKQARPRRSFKRGGDQIVGERDLQKNG